MLSRSQEGKGIMGMDTDGAVMLLQQGWTAANNIKKKRKEKSQIANFARHSNIRLKPYSRFIMS